MEQYVYINDLKRNLLEAINAVYSEMLGEVAKSIKPLTKNKPNPEAQEIFGALSEVYEGTEMMVNPNMPSAYPEPQPQMRMEPNTQLGFDTVTGGTDMVNRPPLESNSSDIARIQQEAMVDSAANEVGNSNAWSYIDMEDRNPTPTRTQLAELPTGAVNPMSPTRTIAPDGTRIA